MIKALARAARWLLPWYWAHRWGCRVWVGHDCEENPIICRLEFLTRWDWGTNWGGDADD